ncbi:hypothetical protein N825_18525 [Skermanella stibiiresistens SB22]|uniref:Uncharacterized protein n=1 Tax=Skermanella stibiiresistens SB22 TaxID=1385369 RepID=W9HC83_9PROT|nr:hypothetical protein [Skermanella stibiiresistens]EWY42307.1 hypothetical protein N825_18525 [Skermanella stibiiresistens SB22]
MSAVEIVADVLFAALAGFIGFLAARVGGEVVARIIVTGTAATSLRTKLRRCAPMLSGLDHRRTRLRVAMAQAEAHRRKMERDVEQRQSKIAELNRRDEELIRIIGHRRPGWRLFRAVMINRHVQTAHREARVHPQLDASWARAQHVDVWAPGIPEAKSFLDSRFPLSLGFVVVEIIEPQDNASLSDGDGAAA